MRKKTSGTPQGLFTYAVKGERGGNNSTSYRSWIPPKYRAPCILDILARQVSPLPVFPVTTLPPREMKTPAPRQSHLKTWVKQTKGWVLHLSLPPHVEIEGKQTQQTAVGPMASSDFSGEAAKEGGKGLASQVSAHVRDVM